ncbi:GDSL-type esterase/lipase family protein [Arthrobacter sp. D1-29]
MGKVARFLSFVVLLVLVLVSAAPTPTSRYPRSMAAIGDSITRAFSACCGFGDHPVHSWSSGDSGNDGVVSHYERLLRLQPAISGRNYNNSRSGAKVAGIPAQAAMAASQRAAYVTVLVGANDLCTSSANTMTTEAAFRAAVDEALAILDRMRPRPKVFVSSIPDLYQLWTVLHSDPAAQAAWSGGSICQSMLSASNSEETRQLVVQRQAAFNAILSSSCAAYPGMCRSDGGAVYGYKFTASDVSVLDYFHPSLEGQNKLAGITWDAVWQEGDLTS